MIKVDFVDHTGMVTKTRHPSCAQGAQDHVPGGVQL